MLSPLVTKNRFWSQAVQVHSCAAPYSTPYGGSRTLPQIRFLTANCRYVPNHRPKKTEWGGGDDVLRRPCDICAPWSEIVR